MKELSFSPSIFFLLNLFSTIYSFTHKVFIEYLTFVSDYSKHLKYISEQKEALTSAVGHSWGLGAEMRKETSRPKELRSGGGEAGAGLAVRTSVVGVLRELEQRPEGRE